MNSSNDKSLFPGFTALLAARIILALAFIFFFCFLTVSLIYFPRKELGAEVLDLGLYGDYVGGILGTIVSFATLGVTIYLAVILSRIEKENISASIETQKSVALMQMKHHEFSLFKTNCDLGFELWDNVSGPLENITKADKMIKGAINRIQTMFPELESHSFFEFRILAYASMRAPDFVRQIRNEDGSINYDVYTEELFHQMVDNLSKGRKEYYILVRKLSEWVFG